jgi:hypothetical protein
LVRGEKVKRRFVLKLRGRKPVKHLPESARAVVGYEELIDLINRKGQVGLDERVTHLEFTPEGITYVVKALS